MSAFPLPTQGFSTGNALKTESVAFCARLPKRYFVGVSPLRNTYAMAAQRDSMAISHPALAAEALGWDAKSYTAGSHAKVLWKCKVGHEYEMPIKSRTLQGYGCPICSGKRILPGFNDLKTLFPQIAAEAVDCDTSLIAPTSKQKVKWRCSLGHNWEAVVGNRTSNGAGCPFCSNKQVLIGFNDLAYKYPKIAVQADGWDPQTILFGAKKKLSWKCEVGHKWSADVGSRTSRGLGCPVCSNRKLVSGVNDLAESHPEIAAQADGWDPRSVSSGTKQIMSWVCGNGHKFKRSVSHRTTRSAACPVCSNEKLLPGLNDLATTHPNIAKEADGWDPSLVFAGTHKKLDWKCPEGHKYSASGTNRTGLGSNCPVCSNKSVQAGFNDLATTSPEIALQADGWDPATVTEGSHSLKAWKCARGHTWKAVVRSRAIDGRNCPYCTNHKALAGFNDLKTKFPTLANEAVGWDPSEYLPGSGVKKLWKCENGHEWKAAISNRTTNSTGCPSCSVGGFDPNKDGWLYFLRHDDWGLLQIGISNVLDKRLYTHKALGWNVLETRGPLAGDVTHSWEQSILKSLKRHGAKFEAEKIAGKFSGHTESWIESSFPAESLKELMNLVEEDEDLVK